MWRDAFVEALRRCVRGGTAPIRRSRLGDAMALFFAATLLLAAMAKLAGGVVPDGTVLSSRAMTLAAVGAEFLLGAWLLSGIGAARAATAGRWFFTALFGVALYEALLGRESCGCLGAGIRLNPWYAVGFDLVAVVAFTLVPSRARGSQPTRSRRFAFGAWLTSRSFACVAIAILALQLKPSRLTDGGDIIGSGNLVAVDPQNWVGRPLPLLPYIEGADPLAVGRWVVVFYHHGCSSCKRRIPQFEALARESAAVAQAPRFAFVEIPPYAPRVEAATQVDGTGLHVRLNGDRLWALPLPTVLRLEDATVTALSTLGQEILASVSYDAPAIARGDARQSRSDFPDAADAWRRKWLGEIACGPLSLITVLESLGIELSDADRDEIIAAAGTKGTDMGQLKSLAEQFGAHTLPVELSPAALRQTGLPAVVHVSGTGFAAVTDYSSSGLDLVFPMKPPMDVPDARFANVFGARGVALLVARRPIAPERLGFGSPSPGDRAIPTGAHLRPGKRMLAVGRIYRLDWTCEISLHNDGDEPLVIAEAVAVSSTTTPRVMPATISPHAAARLHVSGRAERPGAFKDEVTLVSNSVGGRATKLPVHGFVDEPVFVRRPAVAFDPVVEGVTTSTTVPIALSEGVDFNTLICTPDDANLLGAELIDQGDGAVALRIDWKGRAQAGWWKARVRIATGEPDSVASSIDVAAHVLAPIEARPPQIWIRDAELRGQRSWSRRLLLKRNVAGSCGAACEFSDVRLGRAIAVTTSRDDDGNLRVALSPTAGFGEVREAAIDGDACFTFEDGHSCTVHVAVGDDALTLQSTAVLPTRPE